MIRHQHLHQEWQEPLEERVLHEEYWVYAENIKGAVTGGPISPHIMTAGTWVFSW